MGLENGGESNMYDGELGDLRFRDRLRMQRDDWKFVMSELSKSEAVNADILASSFGLIFRSSHICNTRFTMASLTNILSPHGK